MKKKGTTILLIVMMLMFSLFSGCSCSGDEYPKNPNLDTSEEVTIRIVASWKSFPAMDKIAEGFEALYDNCTIEYEYLQSYSGSLITRLNSTENSIDLFITTNIQSTNNVKDRMEYALDLYSDERVDLSGTFDGLVTNFEDSTSPTDARRLYAVPLGADIRGIFVNKTLLNSLNIAVPTNSTQFVAACKTLKDAGYVPIHGVPGSCGQQLMYPYVCNLIANASDPTSTYNKVNARGTGVSELFREPMKYLYDLVKEDYYKYKYVENDYFYDHYNVSYPMYTKSGNEEYAQYFFNVVDPDGDKTYEKKDDVGIIPFMVSSTSIENDVKKIKADYESAIDYVFMPAPLGEDGGYAYMSPAHGIAINKNSTQLDWAIEFFNYLFFPKNNTTFCDEFGILPNTSGVFKQAQERYDIPVKNISHVGQATFGSAYADYGFYNIITDTLTEISKGNNPQYTSDGLGTLYSFDFYMDRLTKRFAGEKPADIQKIVI